MPITIIVLFVLSGSGIIIALMGYLDADLSGRTQQKKNALKVGLISALILLLTASLTDLLI